MSDAHEQSELQRLRAVELLLTSITRHAPDYIIKVDRAGMIEYMNRPAPGYSLEEMVGSNVRRWMAPEAHLAFARTVDEVFSTGQLSSYESKGSVTGRHYVNRVSPVIIDGEVESAVLITHDITDLKRIEQELRDSEARNRALVEASFEGLIISVGGAIVDANQAAAAMFGYSVDELVGLSPRELATAESARIIRDKIERRDEAPYEAELVRRDGSVFPVELLGRNIDHHGQPARITGLRDLTERRRLEREHARREERLRQAQKLETLGVLASGIAHDFNNLLAVALANADLASRRIDDPVVVRRGLEQIRTAVRCAAELTSQLLVYAGRGERVSAPIDLSSVVDSMTQLLELSISKKAELRRRLAPDLPSVRADMGQMRQIALNLLLNASESLGDEPGFVEIATGLVQADAAYLAECAGAGALEPGEYVFIEVSDSGAGMDDETQARMFDPFFSTKFAGRGLGLSAVQGIVRAHGGAIHVRSELGAGSRIRVLIPAAGRSMAAQSAETPAEPEVRGAGVNVLLAEDEPILAATIREMLESGGHRVVMAVDGVDALEKFRATTDLGLVMLDLTMPKKGGLEVLGEIRAARPDLPVVLTSGYADPSDVDPSAAGPHTAFLRKPYGIDELFHAVRGALAEP